MFMVSKSLWNSQNLKLAEKSNYEGKEYLYLCYTKQISLNQFFSCGIYAIRNILSYRWSA